MSSQIFSQAQLKGLSTTLQVANYASAQFINNSNYGFTLSNANNNEVINYVEPWSNTVIPLGLATLKMVNTPSLNVANPFTPLQSSEQLTVVLSSLSVSSPSRQSMMSLTNVNITGSDVTIPISGTVNANINAGQSIGINGDVPVTASDSSGLPVTTGSGGLSVTVNNTVDMSITSSTVTLPVSVGDATLNTSITSSTVTLDNNITNASITTNMAIFITIFPPNTVFTSGCRRTKILSRNMLRELISIPTTYIIIQRVAIVAIARKGRQDNKNRNSLLPSTRGEFLSSLIIPYYGSYSTFKS